MNVKNCTVCNIKIDEDNCKKDRNICEKCYNANRKNIKIKKRKENLMTWRNHKSIMLTTKFLFQRNKNITTTTLMYQPMKIIDTLLSVPVT